MKPDRADGSSWQQLFPSCANADAVTTVQSNVYVLRALCLLTTALSCYAMNPEDSFIVAPSSLFAKVHLKSSNHRPALLS